MIVWGTPIGSVAGGRYNPTNDTWMIMSTAGQPSPTTGAKVVWTGSEMIARSWKSPDTMDRWGRYDPTSDTWRAMSLEGLAPNPSSRQLVWIGTELFGWELRAVQPAGRRLVADLLGRCTHLWIRRYVDRDEGARAFRIEWLGGF